MSDYININNGNKSNLELYFSKIDDKITNNTKKILNLNNIDINLKQ